MNQIENITPYERIAYQCAPAKQLPLAADCTSLITATQAAHRFHLPQVKRAAAPGCVMALNSYGVLNHGTNLHSRSDFLSVAGQKTAAPQMNVSHVLATSAGMKVSAEVELIAINVKVACHDEAA